MNQVPDNFSDKSVCIMGMGYVGLTLATVMAEVGFDVIGIEIRDDVLEMLDRGEPHFHEPGLAQRLKRLVQRRRIKFSKHIPENCSASVYIITVGTPLDTSGKIRTDMIENVSREVSRTIKKGDMVIMRSTVKLGTTRNVVLPILNESGVTFDLAFCPERTLEGQALAELRRLPQIAGGYTLPSTIRAAQMFQFLTPTVVRVADIETAEVVKMVDNTQRDVHFAFSNEVARICDAVGISAAEVVRAGKLGYARTNLPMPGPVGGPCLEKDPHILAEGLQEYGIQPEISLAARRVNERQPEEVIGYLSELLRTWHGFPETPVISLLGIAFKGRPATDDLRGTMARPILNALQKRFPQSVFRGYDPVVSRKEINNFGLDPCTSLNKALKGAHLALILNNHVVFENMSIEDEASAMSPPGLIYDFWNHFDVRDLSMPEGVAYMALGSHGKTVAPERGKS